MATTKKCDDKTLEDLYRKLGSVWEVAKRVGMCGQSVHERLTKLGVMQPIRVITEQDRHRIREVYESGIKRGDGKLDALCDELGRTKQLISRTARSMGLTTYSRSMTAKYAENMGQRVKKAWAEQGHPRGMSGKKHSEGARFKMAMHARHRAHNRSNAEQRDITERAVRTKRKNGTKFGYKRSATWKNGWREVGGRRIYFRSMWEANYARYLEHIKAQGKVKSWRHEPKAFELSGYASGPASYLPDFHVVYADGSEAYVEVKGWMDTRSKLTIRRFRQRYPEQALKVVDAKAYRSIEAAFAELINEWNDMKPGAMITVSVIDEQVKQLFGGAA